ncbi:hypothetical protein L6R53_21590 [Myxococcota bacterium]|nr:hypothetical protein [Myxococcota bacterium]
MSEEFEAFDRTWRLPGRSLDAALIRATAEEVARAYEGVAVQVKWEEDDEISCLFRVQGAEGEPLEVELSVYDLGADGRVLSLEADAGDNADAWEEACQLAEDLADGLGAQPLDL